jgi:hypothetical protein
MAFDLLIPVGYRKVSCSIHGFHNNGYEQFWFLWYNAVYSGDSNWNYGMKWYIQGNDGMRRKGIKEKCQFSRKLRTLN